MDEHSVVRVIPSGLLVVASSTGGPGALLEVMKALPANYPFPVLLIQHMMPEFTRSLADRLNALVPMRVQEAVDGDRLRPGVALMAAGGRHLLVGPRLSIRLNDDPPRNGVRPSVDTTLESVASLFRTRLLAVVLTGMGRDGAEGAQVVKKKGGHVVVQDEASCVVYGMPKAVVDAGAADRVLPLDAIGEYVDWYTGSIEARYARSSMTKGGGL